MKKKPKKWGYKIWALGRKSGYVHKFYVAGDNTVRAQDADLVKAIGKSGEVIVNLTENLAQGSYVFLTTIFPVLNCLQNCRSGKSIQHPLFG